jgi:hypothetical protein
MNVRYTGYRGDGRVVVRAYDEEGAAHQLAPRNDLDNHSPDGFEWGYAGSGPAQLALAILADALGDDQRAIRLHQPFKAHFVQNFPKESWEMQASDVRIWALCWAVGNELSRESE